MITKKYCSTGNKAFALFCAVWLLTATSVSAGSLIINSKGYVSGQLSRVTLDRNQNNAFGRIYIGEVLLGHNSATFISLGNQPHNLVSNPWRFCFEKDEYDEIEDLIGNEIVLEFKTPRSSALLSCTSFNELVDIYPVNDSLALEYTHLIGNIRTSATEISHGVEFGRIVNVIKNKNSFNVYFMTMQIGNGGSKFRHFIMDDTDLFDFAVDSLHVSARVKVHYSERLSRKNFFGFGTGGAASSFSYVAEIEMVD